MKFVLIASAFLGLSASSALAAQSCAERTHTGPMGTCSQTCSGNVGSVTCTGNSGNLPLCYSVNYNVSPPNSSSMDCAFVVPGGPAENPMAPKKPKSK